MLRLIDVLNIKNIPLNDHKIHLATGENPPAYEAFIRGEFKDWQEGQNNKNFPCTHILSLVSLGNNRWVFAGVYKVLGVEKGVEQPFRYRTELIPNQEDIIGRIIVFFKRPSRASYIWGDKYSKFIMILEIMPEPLSIGEFPGFHNISIQYKTLCVITKNQVESWKSALSNVYGIYLIADGNTGKMYVGCAKGEGGIWQRFNNYCETKHGGNKDLMNLLNDKGLDYANNFHFSILEVIDTQASEKYIFEREGYWKSILLTRKFGLNSN